MTCTGTGSCNQGRAECRDGCHKPRRTCAELGVCQNRTPPCGDDCLPILHQHNSDGTSPHDETRDLIELALDALLAFALSGPLYLTFFAPLGFGAED